MRICFAEVFLYYSIFILKAFGETGQPQFHRRGRGPAPQALEQPVAGADGLGVFHQLAYGLIDVGSFVEVTEIGQGAEGGRVDAFISFSAVGRFSI